jgi:hypothetical protein
MRSKIIITFLMSNNNIFNEKKKLIKSHSTEFRKSYGILTTDLILILRNTMVIITRNPRNPWNSNNQI